MKTKTLKTGGTTSAAPIVAALLAGIAVGAVAYAKRKELAAAGSLAAKKLDPVVDGAKSKFGDAVKAIKTRAGDILINFGEAAEEDRKRRLQDARNRVQTHPQGTGETDRLHAVG